MTALGDRVLCAVQLRAVARVVAGTPENMGTYLICGN